MQDLIQAAGKVKLLVLDVDGILSNGYIIYDGEEIETKCFNVKDGMGIKAVKWAGVKTALDHIINTHLFGPFIDHRT